MNSCKCNIDNNDKLSLNTTIKTIFFLKFMGNVASLLHTLQHSNNVLQFLFGQIRNFVAVYTVLQTSEFAIERTK